MTPMNDTSHNERVTTRTATRWGLIASVLTLPVFIVVGYFVHRTAGLAAWVALGMMIGAVRAFWSLKQHAWFRMSAAALTINHVVLIAVVPWPARASRSRTLACRNCGFCGHMWVCQAGRESYDQRCGSKSRRLKLRPATRTLPECAKRLLLDGQSPSSP